MDLENKKRAKMSREIIHTEKAPAAIGTYSQAVKIGGTVYVSGQIPLDPKTMQLVSDDIREQIKQVFENLQAVIQASGADFCDVVKATVYLTDLNHFALVNEIMAQYFKAPYPARVAIGVQSLPKGSLVEIDATLVLTND